MSFDETTTLEDVDKLFEVFACGKAVSTCGDRLFSDSFADMKHLMLVEILRSTLLQNL